jgi:hypothetical protein
LKNKSENKTLCSRRRRRPKVARRETSGTVENGFPAPQGAGRSSERVFNAPSLVELFSRRFTSGYFLSHGSAVHFFSHLFFKEHKAGLKTIKNFMQRCGWAKNDLSIAYHDAEWGVPLHDDRRLFEFLILEGAQAGLSWNLFAAQFLLRKSVDKFFEKRRAKIQSAVESDCAAERN